MIKKHHQELDYYNLKLLTLQLQGIKSQPDPHSTFNSLNSIASLIYLEDRHAAYDYLKIVNEDNVVGREKAAGQSLSTSKRLKITGEFYDILNQLNKKPLSHTISDLYDYSGTPDGTHIEVLVQVDQ